MKNDKDFIDYCGYVILGSFAMLMFAACSVGVIALIVAVCRLGL